MTHRDWHRLRKMLFAVPTSLRKHWRRVVGAAGALMVFVTFVLNEVWRDKLRDLSARITLEQGFTELGLQNRVLREKLDKIIRKVGAHDMDVDGKETLGNGGLFNPNGMKNSTAVINLFGSLGLSNELYGALKDEHGDLEREFKEITREITNQTLTVFDDSTNADAAEAQRTEIESHIIRFQTTLRTTALLDRVEYEKRNTRYRWLTIFFYTLGWALGLFGKFAGFEVPGPEE